MAEKRGMMEATVLLNKNTCYFMKTGRCSLELVDQLSLTPTVKLSPSDLLYCPHLYQTMRSRKQDRLLKIVPCECNHAEIKSGAQRACIASQKRLQMRVERDKSEKKDYPLCSVCGRQMTFDEENAANQGGARIVTFRAVVEQSTPESEEK